MRLIACLVALSLLGACSSYVDPAHQATYDKMSERRQLVNQGKMKESVAIKGGIEDILATPRVGPAKAEMVKTLMVAYKAAKAMEAGKITKEKYDEIVLEVRIRAAELDKVTDAWMRQNRAQNARNWARALKGYSDYLNAIQPRQPTYIPAPSIPETKTMDCYERRGRYSKGTFDCYKQ